MKRATLSAIALVMVVAACAGDTPQPSLAPSGDVPAATAAPPAPSGTSSSTAAAQAETTPETTTTEADEDAASGAALVPLDELDLELTLVAGGFAQPVFVTAPPNDGRLFVVDQPGIVWVIDGDEPEVFLDIRDRVVSGGERGLLGLAFSPDFVDSGRFYLNYTAAGSQSVVSEFLAQGDEADSGTERIVLEVSQPASNHNGGMITFGPEDHLWIGFGDGGRSDDAFGHGQNGSTLLGAMLRIDPTTDPYTPHPDNPGGEWREEIWAIGLRNPWRFSIDGDTVWIGDVGQGSVEEVDRLGIDEVSRPNFGWPLFEGSECYLSDCSDNALVAPVYEYSHREGNSITGGYVYRGTAIPELEGHYLFADFGSGWIRSFDTADAEPAVFEWFEDGSVALPTSFGVDAQGEIYVTSAGGSLYRITRS